MGQVAGIFWVDAGSGTTLEKFANTLRAISAGDTAPQPSPSRSPCCTIVGLARQQEDPGRAHRRGRLNRRQRGPRSLSQGRTTLGRSGRLPSGSPRNIAEVVGALLAALFLNAMYGGILNGATEPTPSVSPLVAVLTEAVLTLGLVSVILGTASGARNAAQGAIRRRKWARVGVQGILLAIAASIVIHIEHSYRPYDRRALDDPGLRVRAGRIGTDARRAWRSTVRRELTTIYRHRADHRRPWSPSCSNGSSRAGQPRAVRLLEAPRAGHPRRATPPLAFVRPGGSAMNSPRPCLEP